MNENNKKQNLLLVLGILAIIGIFRGITYAFFNYTRTGSTNLLKTGRISFTTNQTNTINLTNVFPISSDQINNDIKNVGSVTINITGDTMYSNGIEYVIKAINVNNTINNKKVPLSIDFSIDGNLGSKDDDYFDNRDSSLNHLYNILSYDTLENNDELLVGLIAKNASGINGSITVKAYLDKDRITISDTYDGTESDNMGTSSDWVNDRVVLTTTEWNSLQSSGISFQVKVEANEGIWVNDPDELIFDITNATVIKYDINKEICLSTLNGSFPEDDVETLCSGGTISDGISNYDLRRIFEDVGETVETLQNMGLASNIRTENATKTELGVTYASGQFTYEYIGTGWRVYLTDMNSTDPVNTKLYTKINGEMLLSTAYMFLGSHASYINTSRFKTKNILDMTGMFGATQVTTLDLNNFDTRNVREMNYIFSNTKLDVIDLSSFDTSNTTLMIGMFQNSKVKTIYVSNKWNVENVTSGDSMFADCNNLVGGYSSNPTFWSNSNPTDKTYAHVDEGESNPGYFTYKAN